MKEKFIIAGAYRLPAVDPVTVDGADVTVPTITAASAQRYSIAGNCGLSGAAVTLDTGAGAVSGGDGSYAFTGLANGTYVVTPSAIAASFSPAAWTVNVRSADVAGVDFAAETVDATVTVAGEGLAGVAVTLTQGETVLSGTTDDDGVAVISQVPDGVWTVGVSKDGYTYGIDEPTGVVEGVSIEIGGITGSQVTAGGRVVDTVGAGVSGVTVTLTGGQSDTTDTDGYWSIGPVLDGDYTATPSKDGWNFDPESRSFTVARENAEVDSFTGSSLPVTGLAGYWPLLDGSAEDASGNGHTLAIVGSFAADIADPAGNEGKAHAFGGSDYLTLADHDDFDFGTAEFSISVWVSCIGSGISGGFRTMINKNRSATQSPSGEYLWAFDWYLSASAGGEYPKFRTDAAVIATDTGVADLLDASGNGTGVWHHIVFVRGAAASAIYVDGTKYTVIHSPASFSNDKVLGIGGDSGGYTIKWKGGIAHVRVYKGYSLTDADVGALYNAKS